MILVAQHNYMKLKNKIFALSLFITFTVFAPAVFAAPTLTDAPVQAVGIDTCKSITLNSIGNIFNYMSCTLIKSVVPFLFTLATAAFIWGIIQYFLNPDNEEKRKAGKSYIIWGLVSLFVMVAMWGLVGLIGNTFGVKTLIPQLSNQ